MGSKKITLMVLLVSLFFIGSALAVQIPQELSNEISQKGSAEIFVLLSQEKSVTVDNFISETGIKNYQKYRTIKAFSAVVDKNDLKKLETNPNVEAISFATELFEPMLDVSVPQINATNVWPLTVNAINITGQDTAVCVVDSGIDTDHPAFAGRIIAQHCFCRLTNTDGFPCCPNNQIEDTNAEDDYGHGTRMAGVAAGNYPPYIGVAPSANIVAVKTCYEKGSCHQYDMAAGIDWCVANAQNYNISAISVSLGGGLYSSYCDAQFPHFSQVINSATANGIPVAVSAGNYGYLTQISSPACIQNAIAVGGVDDGDGIHFNRATILDVLAPGWGIMTPTRGGGVSSSTGTSPSAAHVSGSIVLIKQFSHLQEIDADVSAIENALKNTGKVIYDSESGLSFPRIDVLSAIFSLDNVSPAITFAENSLPNNAFASADSVISINSNEILTEAWINIDNKTMPLEGSGTNWEINTSSIARELITNNQSGRSESQMKIRLIYRAYEYSVSGIDSAGNTGQSETRIIKFLHGTPPQIARESPLG